MTAWQSVYIKLLHQSPYPDKEVAETSALSRSTVIRLRLPERRSTRLTPPALVPTVDKADEMILQDTLQVSLAEHKIREEQEARENVALVDEHLASKEIENMESPEVEIAKEKEVEITQETEVEITQKTPADKHVKKQVMQQVPEQVQNQVLVYIAEGLILEGQKAKEETDRLIAKAILQERGNIQAQISTQIENAIANVIPSQVDASVRNYMSGHILHVHPAQSQTSSVPEQQYQLTPAVRPREQDDPHDDAHPEGDNSAKRQKTSEYEAYVSGESSSGQVFQEEQAPSTSGNQEQDDDFDF
ncbi:hypothetical protein Tco_0446115 [Tanacetum coccineum]